jgi:ABC-type Fe3+ transport system permease subunit
VLQSLLILLIAKSAKKPGCKMNLFQNIEKVGEKNRIVPGWLRFLIVAPFLTVAIYMMVEQSGLYYSIREFQFDLMDAHYLVLTYGLTLIICLLPAIPLIYLARRHYEKKSSNS